MELCHVDEDVSHNTKDDYRFWGTPTYWAQHWLVPTFFANISQQGHNVFLWRYNAEISNFFHSENTKNNEGIPVQDSVFPFCLTAVVTQLYILVLLFFSFCVFFCQICSQCAHNSDSLLCLRGLVDKNLSIPLSCQSLSWFSQS